MNSGVTREGNVGAGWIEGGELVMRCEPQYGEFYFFKLNKRHIAINVAQNALPCFKHNYSTVFAVF